MSFSAYYLKSAAVTANLIADVQIITPGGAAVEAADLAAANKGGYEITPQSGPSFTVTAAQFSAYVPLHGTNLSIPSASIVQAAQVTAVQAVVTGGSTVNLSTSPLIGEWLIQSTQALIDNATFNNTYAAYA
jgi:hypothetical protein